MIDNLVLYRFETLPSFEYRSKPFAGTEIEHGESDWVYIRRRQCQLASERGENIHLYVFESTTPHHWVYIGYAEPDGSFYYHQGNDPYVLLPNGTGFRRKPSQAFCNWADEYFSPQNGHLGTPITRSDLYISFCDFTRGTDEYEVSPSSFRSFIYTYCLLNGLVLTSIKDRGFEYYTVSSAEEGGAK